MKKDKERSILLTIIIALGAILALLLFSQPNVPKQGTAVVKTKDGQWKLWVQGEPYIVQGVVYQPIPIGYSHHYNFWADPQQPWIKDGQLMQQMHVNTVRFFSPGKNAGQTRAVIGQLYQLYGIRTIMGHWMDYWRPGNYADAQYREALTQRVLEMVKAYKDEEGILMWVLGNENNLSWHPSARISWSCPEVDKIQDSHQKELAKARIYYSLINQIARRIKKIDPKHPVALGSADTFSLEVAKQACPDIDLVALTAYRGKTFGSLWREVKEKTGKPVLIMEFGCDSFNAKTGKEDQQIQSIFLQSQWQDIKRNQAGADGEGNSLGGCIFEWNDEWWKHDEFKPASWYVHNTEGDWSSGGYYFDIAAPNNLNVNEEWWGIMALSSEKEEGINKRLPRKIYYQLQEIWKTSRKVVEEE